MSRGSVSIDVWSEVSIDVGWKMSIDGRRVSSVDGGERVSVDETVSGSTVADENRATNKCCSRSLRNVVLC
ncbi:hypothetical protein F2Q70_00030815 [Brassica cretica]|uniref:Uncharacterized protein n=1 Tax=Brassica cretica TaxID=69181 RepID=A0A8S9FK80_BRACR|nr:hypothetical protein F2Q70_00030815 [Brassica cretica]